MTKSDKYKAIPIAAAKVVSKKYDKDQVIIVTWDAKFGVMHVTTYGKSIKDCKQAAMGGNLVKRALGFAEHLCNSAPARAGKRLPTSKDSP